MTNGTEGKRIEELLAAYGADPARWPPTERGKAHTLGAGGPTRATREASALDRLLTEAAARDEAAGASDPALIERIMARTGSAGAQPSTDMIRLDEVTGTRRAHRTDRPPGRLPAAAAALLAACLALGVFVGSLPATQTTVANIGALAGLDLAATSQSGALDEDFWVQDNEDIL